MGSIFLIIRWLVDFFKIFICMQEILRFNSLWLNNWFLNKFFFVCCTSIFIGITWLYVAIIILFNWSDILTVSMRKIYINYLKNLSLYSDFPSRPGLTKVYYCYSCYACYLKIYLCWLDLLLSFSLLTDAEYAGVCSDFYLYL